MLYLMVLLLFSNAGYVRSKNVGSTLFYNLRSKSDCWNEDDLAKLRVRKTFDELLTPQVNPDRVNTKFVKDTIKYFRNALHSVEHNEDPHTASILKAALCDTIGGNLRSDILPTVRFSYYAGYVSYRNARQLHSFYDEIKEYLNTQGLGWKRPTRVPQWSNLTVAKIAVGTGRVFNPCACLVTKLDSNSCIHLPSPKLDDNDSPAAIALPFKKNGLVSLSSSSAENILLKYYTTASRCILHSSPRKCRHSDFVNFNNALWHWMKRDVAPHLVDEKLYAAYGGVLRIAAAVQNYGKGLSRRNLFDNEEVTTKWLPWRAFTDTYIFIDKEWTPQLYICIVLLAALAICLIQMCYNYIFGEANNCHCGGWTSHATEKPPPQVTCAKADTNSPLIIPQQSAVYFSEKRRNKTKSSKTKTSSLGSIHKQKVFDLNENTEKMMAVIMSDNENEDSDTSQSNTDTEESYYKANENRPKSPPKIETSMAQLKIERTPCSSKKPSVPFSTSTLTCSDAKFCRGQQASESAWSGTGTTTSGRTCSSTSSKSQSRRSRSSRDLAWARHVIAKTKTTRSTRSTSGTDLNINSFIKAASNR